jgi:hypothetical protein
MQPCACCGQQHKQQNCCCGRKATSRCSVWFPGKYIKFCNTSDCAYTLAINPSGYDMSPCTFDWEAYWLSATQQPLPLPPDTATCSSSQATWCTGLTDHQYSPLFGLVAPSGTPTIGMFEAAQSDPRFPQLRSMTIKSFMDQGGFAYTGEVRCVRSAFCSLNQACNVTGACSLLHADPSLLRRANSKAASHKSIAADGYQLNKCNISHLSIVESTARADALQKVTEVKRAEARVAEARRTRQATQLDTLRARMRILETSNDDQLVRLVRQAASTGKDWCFY